MPAVLLQDHPLGNFAAAFSADAQRAAQSFSLEVQHTLTVNARLKHETTPEARPAVRGLSHEIW